MVAHLIQQDRLLEVHVCVHLVLKLGLQEVGTLEVETPKVRALKAEDLEVEVPKAEALEE